MLVLSRFASASRMLACWLHGRLLSGPRFAWCGNRIRPQFKEKKRAEENMAADNCLKWSLPFFPFVSSFCERRTRSCPVRDEEDSSKSVVGIYFLNFQIAS